MCMYSTVGGLNDSMLQEWLKYQALWDLQPDMLYERLGTDLNKWMKTLVEIKFVRDLPNGAV